MPRVTLTADEIDLCRYLKPGEAWPAMDRAKLFALLRERRAAARADVAAESSAPPKEP